jgi:hypothetical protein
VFFVPAAFGGGHEKTELRGAIATQGGAALGLGYRVTRLRRCGRDALTHADLCLWGVLHRQDRHGCWLAMRRAEVFWGKKVANYFYPQITRIFTDYRKHLP